MNTIKIILKWVGGIVLLLVVISFFLPSKVHVERKALVKAKPEVVYQLISNLPDWEKWSPWHRIDPKIKLTYGEIKEGKGASYSWTSDHSNVGNGSTLIEAAKPFEYIKTEMDFMENGKASAEYFLTKNPEGTEVRWTMDSDMGWNPIGRYVGLFMDKLIGPDYEKGLHYLDSVAQISHPREFDMKLEMGIRPAQKLLLIKSECKEEEISQKLGEIYGKIEAVLGPEKIQMIGAPMALYEEPANGVYKFEAGFPVDKKPMKSLPNGIYYLELPEMPAAIAHFFGPYEKTMEGYTALEKFITENGKSINGKPMESYISDPMEAKTPLDIKTDIIWPVK